MLTEYEKFLILSDCHGTEIAEALMTRREEIVIKQQVLKTGEISPLQSPVLPVPTMKTKKT